MPFSLLLSLLTLVLPAAAWAEFRLATFSADLMRVPVALSRFPHFFLAPCAPLLNRQISRRESNRQRGRPMHVQARVRRPWELGGELHFVRAAKEFLHGDPAFEPREG